MDLAIWAQLLGMMVIGMIPFGLMGLFLGLIGSANLTNALATTLMLLLSFASGLFVPLSLLPDILQKIAPYLPPYQLGQLPSITFPRPSNTHANTLYAPLPLL